MKDDTFELMTKMYAEFSGRFEKLETGQQQITQRLDKVDNRFDKVETGLIRLRLL